MAASDSNNGAALTAKHNDLIAIFSHHKVAANLLMIMMLLGGLYGLFKLNIQFFPNFEVEIIQVRTVWTAAAPEDVESAITTPLEQALRSLADVDKMTSTSSKGVSVIALEYPEGTDMGEAVEQVDQAVAGVRNLPADAEQTSVARVQRTDPVAKLLVIGSTDLRELRPLVRRFETELLDAGLAKIEMTGLPEEEIAISVPQQRLQELGLSLEQIGQRISAQSQDRSAGFAGRDDVARQLRTLDQQRSVLGFESTVIEASNDGQRVVLGDIAEVERRIRDNQIELFYNGRPAVEIAAKRIASADSLQSARILNDWIEQTRPLLPPGVELQVFDENWTLIRDRTQLLLKNGLSGLVLVVLILFIFLNGRVAFWVTIGIPVSFMATLLVLYLLGGSINMISLFALIMALGIIVDDAIVVGEDSLAHFQHDKVFVNAAELGAKRMFAPVMSSSLTTIAAFLPLLIVGGHIGKILYDIPLVIICVIIASIIECFFVLPGHLQHGFKRAERDHPGKTRQRLDRAFEALRDRGFTPLVRAAVRHKEITVATAIAALWLAISLPFGGFVSFTFFPAIEGNMVQANASFVSGTPEARTRDYVQHMRQALNDTEEHFGGGLIRVAVERVGGHVRGVGGSSANGPQFGGIEVELIASDQREVRNEAFIAEWKSRMRKVAGLEQVTVASRRGGPPGRDLDIRLYNAPPEVLKTAALELRDTISALPGVSGIEDDMPYGPQQLILSLTPQGQALGLTTQDIARQMSAAFDGHLVQIFTEGIEELEVRVRLPDSERNRLSTLTDLVVFLNNGGSVPLTNVVNIRSQQGFDALRHLAAERSVTVMADVDGSVGNAGEYRQNLETSLLPELAGRYGLQFSFEGKAEDQRKTGRDMGIGAIYGLAMIYLVLAWVFASYGWPLIVMAAIPFGVVGALLGHWLLGIDLTILSAFGIFGLAGIVVNDSIILVVFFKELREKGMATQEAIVEAARLRFRAVLLTSLTTVAGLTPLLFETSLQAQFLIPMVATIAFGLSAATFLVLLVIPAMLAIYEQLFGRDLWESEADDTKPDHEARGRDDAQKPQPAAG